MAGERPVQDSGGGTSSNLCDDCRHLDLLQFDLNANPVQLCVEESTLKKPLKQWGDFRDAVLNRVCAAINTRENNKSTWWVLLIHIKGAKPDENYTNFFSERITDRLKCMLMGQDFSEKFYIKTVRFEAQYFFNVFMLGDFDALVAKDFRSPQPLSHGLLETNLDCIVHHMFSRTDKSNCMFQRPKELEGNSDGCEIPVQECESIQFKSLQPDKSKESAKKAKRDQEQEMFRPTCGKHYVDWLWNKQRQTLGKYIAAFAKIHTGGAFYCGVREADGKNMIEALELPVEWQDEIKEKLQEKIKENMLWVQRDGGCDRGYAVLEPESIKRGKHFDVEFIPVKDPDGKRHNLCILEVRVASFNGVVFNYRGPEVYVFEEKQEEGTELYHPVPVPTEVWLEKLQQHAWCSTHRRPRQPRCGHYHRCSRCQEVRAHPGCCEELESRCMPMCQEA